jgi:activating signal cointegrator 1
MERGASTRLDTSYGDSVVKALTLTQPWATLVAAGFKSIETRSWGTPYRGPLLIHAAKTIPEYARELCDVEPFEETLLELGYRSWRDLPYGVILARCTLVDVLRIDEGGRNVVDQLSGCISAELEWQFGNFAPGRYMWILDNVQPFKTLIPCRGALGLWEPPAEVLEQVHAQLGRVAV